ncbi:MAG: NFACT RNA binding domain-containing protein [Candidatus Micrarchaeota archaeon]
MEIELDAKKTVQQNAAHYYEMSKKLKEKARKAELAIAETKKLIEQEQRSPAPAVKSAAVSHGAQQQKKMWYEAYHWTFIDGNLIIGGRSAKMNDELFKKHLDKEDVFFHADVQGGSVFIAKGGQKMAKGQLEQVARLAACYSRAWNAGRGTCDVHASNPDQVSKANKAGAFYVEGKRNWFKSTPLKLCFVVSSEGKIEYDFEGAGKVCITPDARKTKEESAQLVLKQIKYFCKEKADSVTLEDVMKMLPNGGSRVSN